MVSEYKCTLPFWTLSFTGTLQLFKVESQLEDEKIVDTPAEGIDENPLVQIEGIYLPRIFLANHTIPEYVQLVRSMQMREDDILLLTFPKSGTHFLWEVISMLIAGKAEYVKQSKIFAMMEATTIEDFDSAPSPRILNTHLPLRLLSTQIKEKKVKVIHVYRNVKDVFVSSYFYFRQYPNMKLTKLEDIEEAFFSGSMPYGSYFSYLKDMHDYQKNNPEVPFFTLSFEDMKEDREKMVGKLAEFLGVKASAQLCQDIAQATSLSKMKEADKTKQHPDYIPYVDVFRKGEVGDWKNHLTVAQSERLDAAMPQLQSCDYHFRYTL